MPGNGIAGDRTERPVLVRQSALVVDILRLSANRRDTGNRPHPIYRLISLLALTLKAWSSEICLATKGAEAGGN